MSKEQEWDDDELEELEDDEEEQSSDKVKSDQIPLPPPLEFAFSFSKLAIVMALVLTVAVSMNAGASLWTVTVRGVVAVISLGMVMWVFSFFMAQNTIEAARMEEGLNRRDEKFTESTLETKA